MSESDAAIFPALVDTFIPGDDLFPKASLVGTQHWLLEKIFLELGIEGIDRIIQAIGADFASLSEERQIETIARFEQAQPDLFHLIRALIYFGYYQSPLVVRAVRQLGLVYNDTPQPQGYDLGRFDPALHLPAQPQGRYVPTDDVRRLDLSHLSVDSSGQQDDYKTRSG